MTPSPAPLPLLGTWKLTKCESSHPAVPYPTSQVATFTQQQDAIHFSSEGVYSDGQPRKVSAVFRLDGNWYPATGSALADSVSFRRLADGTIEVKMRKSGVEVGVNRVILAADGRSMTAVYEIAGPGGTTITWKVTSERQ